MLDTPGNLTGIYFWANDIPGRRGRGRLTPARTSSSTSSRRTSRRTTRTRGSRSPRASTRSRTRGTATRARACSRPTSRPVRVGLGAPVTELWMDNWCIVKGAQHPNAAHAWINYICDPEVSLKDLAYHGYNTGIVGVQEQAEAAGLEFLDLVFFSDEQVATMDAGAVTRPRAGWSTSGTRRRPPREPEPEWRRDRQEWRRRGRGAPAPTRAPVRAGDPGLAALRLLLRGPGPVHLLLLVRVQAGHLPHDRDGSALPRPLRGVLLRHVPDRVQRTLQISIVGTILCFLIAFPFAYWLAVKVPPRWRGSCSASRSSRSGPTSSCGRSAG